jgi:hypothetical protein
MQNVSAAVAEHQFLGKRYLYCEGTVPLLFTENENNNQRLFGTTNLTQYVKDGINNYIVNKDENAVNPAKIGTKTSANYQLTIPAKQSQTVKLRLTGMKPEEVDKVKHCLMENSIEYLTFAGKKQTTSMNLSALTNSK